MDMENEYDRRITNGMDFAGRDVPHCRHSFAFGVHLSRNGRASLSFSLINLRLDSKRNGHQTTRIRRNNPICTPSYLDYEAHELGFNQRLQQKMHLNHALIR